MSSSIGDIYDDYQYYEILCKKYNVEPLSVRDENSSVKNWHKHLAELELKNKNPK